MGTDGIDRANPTVSLSDKTAWMNRSETLKLLIGQELAQVRCGRNL